MPTDTNRVRRDDPGDPNRCPVWSLHEVYSNDEVKDWVQTECRTAGIGCLDCKGPLIDSVLKEQSPIRERAREYQEDTETVRGIISDGSEAAREIARETIVEVKQAMGLEYN